jgi:hypothetical protein
MKKTKMLAVAALGLTLGLGACSDPYSPGQRAVGGGVIGGLGGAGIGALIGGLAGSAVGAGVGAATTPQRPAYGY